MICCDTNLFTGKGSTVKADDIRSTSEIVYSALVVIIQFCTSILISKICVDDLRKYCRSTKQLWALCNAVNSGTALSCPKFDYVKSSMDLCFKKFDYVLKCKEMMEVVVKHCSEISKGTYLRKLNKCTQT